MRRSTSVEKLEESRRTRRKHSRTLRSRSRNRSHGSGRSNHTSSPRRYRERSHGREHSSSRYRNVFRSPRNSHRRRDTSYSRRDSPRDQALGQILARLNSIESRLPTSTSCRASTPVEKHCPRGQETLTRQKSRTLDRDNDVTDRLGCFNFFTSLDMATGFHRIGFSSFGFSVNLKKCTFLDTEIEYLVRVVGNGQVRPSPRKIEALVNSPKPTNVKGVRQFLGLAGYFRRYVAGYASKTAPIARLLRKGEPFKWGSEQDVARDYIIHCLTHEPVLAIFDPSLPTELHTDASSISVGAVLLQEPVNERE